MLDIESEDQEQVYLDQIAEESQELKDIEVEKYTDQIAEESQVDELLEEIYQTDSSTKTPSKFFKDPLNPQPE